MLDNPRGENRRRLPIRSPGVLGYCQGSFQCRHWYFQSFFKVGIDIFKDIFKVVIDIFEVVNCSLFTNLTTFPTKVLGIERKVIGQHHASAVLYEHRFIQNKQQFQYWPWLLIQTWNLSKNLHDPIFGRKNFTHWKRLNWDYFRHQ